MKTIWKIIRIVFIVVGVVVLAAVVKRGLTGYELQVSGIKGQVIEIRFDRTDKVRYDEMENCFAKQETTRQIQQQL